MYLLYEIDLKKANTQDDDSDQETSSEEESSSQEDKKNDDDDKLYMDMFTDILSLLVLK